ncbi:hypothetical protein MCUN1_002011 [Malassezia cuniculi]|uniref:Cytochrome c oxidase assembly factor 5 n=1 Tax=Malassezia cuniculi TaxID=948313 RepID=A0AAF0JBC5_9BASI|nr:hypothetical protein MCUN1_002011 [Malassezia cuniculi]
MRGVCDPLREELAECLAKSDCVRRGIAPRDCLKNHQDEFSKECQQTYKGFVDCKRSFWDMRKRFRGIPGAEYSGSSLYGTAEKRG